MLGGGREICWEGAGECVGRGQGNKWVHGSSGRWDLLRKFKQLSITFPLVSTFFLIFVMYTYIYITSVLQSVSFFCIFFCFHSC